MSVQTRPRLSGARLNARFAAPRAVPAFTTSSPPAAAASSAAAVPAYVPQSPGELRGRNASPLRPLPPPPEGLADDTRLGNPLERLQRLGTGWFGAIFEFEGVVVGSEAEVHADAWRALAAEEGKPVPAAWALRRAEGMKATQVISEVLHWTREPGRLRALAARKVALVASRLASRARPRAPPPGLVPFLERLRAHGTPCALASSEPASVVSSALEATQLAPFFSAVVTGEDMERGRPDPDGYLYASQRLGRPPARCLLIGCSNASVEAARDAGMRCVAVAGAAPRFELAAADCVVSRLDELTMQNLQQMFAVEEPRPQPEAMAEAEEQEQEEDDGGDMWGSNLY